MAQLQSHQADRSSPAPGRRAPAVLVVLVVKDGARWLQECLRGLSQQTHPRLGVIAVDNGSTDGSKELLERALGAERVISLPDNPGLPRAVQAALTLEAARGADYMLIHHDDVALDPEAIARMVEVAERIDGVGIVGPKVVDWDDPTILREVGLSTDQFGYPYSPLEPDEIDQGQYDRVREVLFVSSSAMLVSRGALDRTGLPDERLSAYHEDLDFCWRARLAGYRVVMTPLARARHRGATVRGERPGRRPAHRARYFAERASLAAMLKNYGLLSLLWIMPLYTVQGVTKLVLWAVERRFGDVWQVLSAWGWNFLHLPGTIRRRARAQSVRAVPDRSVRRYMAPASMRLRRWTDLASRAVLGRDEELEDAEIGEPIPLGRRAVSLARAHPVATAWVLMVVVAVFAYRHLYGGAPLEGGALSVVPSSPSDYFRELLSGVRTTALGGAQPASPALGFLGVVSAILGASPALAQKALLILLPPAAGFTFYRTFLRETGERVPSVVAAACYGLSAVSLWAFSEGRIPVLVVIAVLPLLAGRIASGFRGSETQPGRFVAGMAMILAAGMAFDPGIALVFAVLALVWLVVPERGERRVRGLGLVSAGAVFAALLVLPLAIDLVSGRGHGLGATVGRSNFASLLRLAPGGGPGSWSVSWFLPVAALLSFTLVEGRVRSAARFLVVAVAAIFLAWGSAAGYLPEAASNVPVYLAVAALGYCALVAHGLAAVLPRVGTYSFGYRQLAVVLVAASVFGGVGLQAALAARGDWSTGPNRLPAAWPVVAGSRVSGDFRVLFLGRLSGEPFAPPGGDPVSTLRVGGITLRYGLVDRTGASALDSGRDTRGDGYDYLERVLAEILTGNTDHGGALLAPLGVRYVVATAGDLPQDARDRLDQQLDLDVVPTLGLIIYRDPRAMPPAGITGQPSYATAASAAGLSAIAELPAPEVTAFHRAPGGFVGPPASQDQVASGGTVFVADQFADGWRLSGGASDVGPRPAFGWAMSFSAAGAQERVRVRYLDQWPRRLEIGLICVLWLGAIVATRRRT